MVNSRAIYVDIFSQLMVVALTFVTTCEGQAQERSYLDFFRENPAAAMNMPPQKWGDSLDGAALEQKIDACRQTKGFNQKDTLTQIKENFASIFAFEEMISLRGQAERFLEVSVVYDRAQDIDSRFRSAAVETQPWSSDYWPIRTGVTAKRYLDPNFPTIDIENAWREGFNYFLANPPNKKNKKYWSPAEKYDFLVADENLTLTNANWAEGKYYQESSGDVERWMGICHGWAPASFMVPRPDRVIKSKVYKPASDKEVEFLPDDIKALLSLKWAKGDNLTADFKKRAERFIGTRCNVKDVTLDPETGRILQSECFDLNPGLWHVIITNHLGQEKRPLIIDAAFDYEVWNQPVTSFNIKYFNPKTLDEVETMGAAIVRFDDPSFVDKFKKFRKSNKAVAVIGVIMTVEYVVETVPRGLEFDGPENDYLRNVTYYYDIEVDAQGRIVGGEWYQNFHPDFIWMPLKNSVVVNTDDYNTINDANVPKYARRASAEMAPLKYVLDKLVKK